MNEKDKNLYLAHRPKPIEASFYIVTLSAGGEGNTHTELYVNTLVAYLPDEAVSQTLQFMREHNQELYEKGKQLGGWRVVKVDSTSRTKMQELFRKAAEKEEKRQHDEGDKEKNQLLLDILNGKDTKLLHDAIREGKLSEHDVVYIHDKLKKEA